MSNNSIIKELVFPISLLLDTPKVRSQFNQLASSNNLRGFNLYKVLEEGMKANYMQCLSSSNVTINNILYPAGTPITDLIASSISGSSVWLNANGTSATSVSTNIKYDRGNVTIGTGGLANDYFSVIPSSTFVQANILNAAGTTTALKSQPVFTLPTAINSSVGYKTVLGTNVELKFEDTSQIEHSHLSIVGRNELVRWFSPSPVRYLGNYSNIIYRGKDIGSTINSYLINTDGVVNLHCPINSTQTSSVVQGRFVNIQTSPLAATNTIQNISTLINNPIGVNISLTNGNNTVNIATLEQFSNSNNMRFEASSSGSSINITNLYGLRLTSPTHYTNTNITNNYGISQEWSSAKNYFAGNVGIGTTDTGNYKLNVNGNTWLNGTNNHIDGNTIFRDNMQADLAQFYRYGGSNLRLSQNKPGGGSIGSIEFFNSQGYSSTPRGIISVFRDDAGDNGYMQFFTAYTTDEPPQARLHIDKNGFIGIGVTSPTNTLHLLGNARLESYASNTYDTTTPTKMLGINSTGEVVSVANQNISNYALVAQTNHGFTTVTPLKFNSSTGLYEEASAIDTGTLARTVFIKSYNANTMIVSSNCIATIPNHTLDIGMSYYTSPTGVGMEREGILQPLDIKQHVLYVIDANTLQINLQQQYY